MSYNTTKITVFNEYKEKKEDMKLFYHYRQRRYHLRRAGYFPYSWPVRGFGVSYASVLLFKENIG